jgi:hypothetical protein
MVYNFSDEAWIESVRVQLRAKLDYRTTRQARRFDEFSPNTSFFLLQIRIANESFSKAHFRHASLFVTVVDANQRESTTRIALNEAQLGGGHGEYALLVDELLQVPLQTRYGKVEGFVSFRFVRFVCSAAADRRRRAAVLLVLTEQETVDFFDDAPPSAFAFDVLTEPPTEADIAVAAAAAIADDAPSGVVLALPDRGDADGGDHDHNRDDDHDHDRGSLRARAHTQICC